MNKSELRKIKNSIIELMTEKKVSKTKNLEESLLTEDQLADCINAGVQAYVAANPMTDMTYDGQAQYFENAMGSAMAGCKHAVHLAPGDKTKNLKEKINMKASDLKNIIRETLSEMDLKENITYYVCDGCPGSGDTFADDPTCGGGCSGGCECTEANTGMTTGGGSEVERTKRRGVKTADAMFKPAKPIKENKINKNKMEKQKLQERFHQLAGIKPLYENEEVESIKEYTKEDLLNEGPELWTVLGGLMGVLGAAGITTQLQMMAEDPAIAEKYPKLEKVFTFLAKVGGALGSGIK